MTFREEELESFVLLFDKKKTLIRNFAGCTHLQLIQDQESPCILYTYSCWESEGHLNDYRRSDLFKETWVSTKALFAEKPEAFSFNRLVDVEK